MALYQDRENNPYHVPDNDDWKDGTIGGRFVKACVDNRWHLSVHYAEMTDLFHNLIQGTWTWNGSAPSSGSARLLDGEARTGQCALAVYAFKKILTTPMPYGLGHTEMNIAYDTHAGATAPMVVPENAVDVDEDLKGAAQGFVSKHPIGGVFGLMPNIRSRTGELLPLYLWQDHKVVKIYNNRYLDVCYNKVYMAKDEMLVGKICRSMSKVEDGDTVDEVKVRLKTHNNHVYFRDRREEGSMEYSGNRGPYAASHFGDVASYDSDDAIPATAAW